MYTFKVGNILASDSEALVNTVNTYGVMGKGIALAFKKSFPENYKAYRKEFEDGKLRIGKMFVYKTNLNSSKFIINFPTKKHWRHKSKVEYIEQGLGDLIQVIKNNQIKSISIPPLGCGNGGLEWNMVKKLIVSKLSKISHEVDIVIFEPGFNLQLRSVKSITQLNPTRAIYLTLIRQYELLGEEITTLIVQKLAYLLQRIGEDLNLKFDKGYYGPYSPNLNKVLEALSPNYLTYSGDLGNPTTTIQLVQERKKETKKMIQDHLTANQKSRLVTVQNLIEGFESSFGLELLATVAFVLEKCPHCTKSDIFKEIHKWTNRKRKLMSDHLISVSFDRVQKYLLVPEPNIDL